MAVRLAFPYSDPDHYVVLYHEEEEIGIIQDPGELDDESRRVLEQMVEKRYHIPAVQRIEDIEEIHNATRWIVETDRGERSFEVRDRHNFRRIGTGEIIVVDVDANRFRIPPRSALDEESQKLLDLYYCLETFKAVSSSMEHLLGAIKP